MTEEWVAGGSDAASTVVIESSPDGITWTGRACPLDGGQVNAVAFDGVGLWMAVGVVFSGVNSGNAVITSPDGITWTAVSPTPSPLGLSNSPRSVAYGAGLWVIGATGVILTSPDTVTWTSQTNPFSLAVNGIANDSVNGITWNGTEFVAVGGGGIIATSPDGITWTLQTYGLTEGNFVAWDGTTWVVAGRKTAHTASAATSPDAITWTNRSSIFDGGRMQGVASDGGTLFVGVGVSGGATAATSPTGSSWTTRTTPFSGGGGGGFGVDYHSGLWVAVGTNSAGTVTLATSPDGVTWTARSSAFDSSAGAAGNCVAGRKLITAAGGWSVGSIRIA